MKKATLKDIADFFGMKVTDMKKEWQPLSEGEKAFFKEEVGREINPS